MKREIKEKEGRMDGWMDGGKGGGRGVEAGACDNRSEAE